jgi:SAM-dependent methyltransferase
MKKRNKAHGLLASYDGLAEEYAKRLFDELDHKPLDRALLARYAQEIRGLGPVCDLGCGPGHITRHLRGLGAEAFGLDLSAGMVEQARRQNPGIEFWQENMLSLDAEDGSWGGIVAFYSIVHVPREEVPRAFGEMLRVLRPGGLLLLSFHVGDELVHLDELWGQEVSLDFHFFRAEDMEELLVEAGFEVEEVVEREPYGEDVEAQTRRAYVFARKPV